MENTNHYIGFRVGFIIFFVKTIDLSICTSLHMYLKMEYNMRSREGKRGGEPLFLRLCIPF